MRLKLAIILAGFAVPALLCAAPPTDQEVNDWFAYFSERQENFGKDGDTSQQAYFNMWREGVKTLQLESMTAEQLSRVQERRVLTFGEVGPRIDERLRELESREDADGAIAVLIRMQLLASAAARQSDRAARQELMEQLLGHPGLDELIRSQRSRLLLRAIAELRDVEVMRANFDGIAAMVDRIAAEGSSWHLDSIFSFYETVAAAAPGGSRGKAAEQLRSDLHTYGTRALAELEQATPEADLAFVRRDVATLGGAAVRGQLLGHHAPELNIDWSSHPEFTGLAQLRGKVVMLDFWSVNCGPCIGAFPKMREMRDRYAGAPFEIIGITHHQGVVPFPGKSRRERTGKDVEREREVMLEYLETFDLTWPTVMTTEDSNSPKYGIRGIPSYVMIDANGIVRKTGYFNVGTLEEKYELIDSLLREAGHEPPG